jgi:hypothetical protein
MLTDAQVERYSRQIVLPEVGARGQERLLAARVCIGGDGAIVADLLDRAGVGALGVPAADADVVVHLAGVPDTSRPVVVGGASAGRLVVTTLVGRPCARCFDWRALDAPAPDPAARLALAALVAGEVLRVILSAPVRGRCTTVHWDEGTAEATAVTATDGCEACGTRA